MADIFTPGMRDWLDKLNQLAEGQLLPIQPDWNAAPGSVKEILNKPDLTTALALKAGINGDAIKNFNVASINDSFIGGMKNRVINGCFRINQRGLTVSQTAPVSGYIIDRWGYDSAEANKYAVGLNSYGWSKAPGHANYVAFGGLSGSTATAAEWYVFQQVIESNNLHDLQYGTANAKTCTLSFWTRSTTAGSHSGAIYNLMANVSFPFSFSIPVADTWTQVKVTIPGDTVNALNTGTSAGLYIRFNLGSGANWLRAAGSWQAGNFTGVIGTVSTLPTNKGIGFAGVQFEIGTGTPFSYRSISEELAMCQRYFETGNVPLFYIGIASGQSAAYGAVTYKVTKRMSPTVTPKGWAYYSAGIDTIFTPGVSRNNLDGFGFIGTGLVNWNGWSTGIWEASAEL